MQRLLQPKIKRIRSKEIFYVRNVSHEIAKEACCIELAILTCNLIGNKSLTVIVECFQGYLEIKVKFC